MAYTIKEIAVALNARFEGDPELLITGAAEPADAGPEMLALSMDLKYADGLKNGQARAAILWDGADWRSFGLEGAIFVGRARMAMAGLTKMFDGGPDITAGIHATACVDPSAHIGEGAAIGPLAIIGAGVVIGQNARIAGHTSIAEQAVIGDDALIHSGVRIGARVRIGNRFIAQPGAVIGGDGFSFVTREKSGVEAARETLGLTYTLSGRFFPYMFLRT